MLFGVSNILCCDFRQGEWQVHPHRQIHQSRVHKGAWLDSEALSNCIVITYRQANKPTAALEYKSARKDMKNGEHKLVHLWELGGGSQLCSLLECALKKVPTPRSCSQLCLHRNDLVVTLLGRRRLFLGLFASSLST